MNVLMVIPTLNEELIIAQNLREVFDAFEESLAHHDWRVVVADNGSSDRTRELVQELMMEEPRLGLWTTEVKGKGFAVRGAWGDHEADVLAFMDADLSTDLENVPTLIAALEEADVAIGSRFHEQAHCERSILREIVSRAYVAMRRTLINLPVTDSQCGFKAMRGEAFAKLKEELTHVGWFFDTELLAFAVKHGMTIKEVPIRWVDERDGRRKSKMNVWRAAKESWRHLRELRRRLRAVSALSGADVKPDVLS